MKLEYELINSVDRQIIENKYHKTDKPFDGFNRMAYHGYDYDETTGLSDEEIDHGLKQLYSELKNDSHQTIKSKLVAYVLDSTRIDVNANDYFVGLYSWGRLIDKHTVTPWYHEVVKNAEDTLGRKRNEFDETGLAWIGLDFDHTVPDWDSLLSLGFCGIAERLDNSYNKLKQEKKLTQKQEIFYQAVKTEYDAAIRLVQRFYKYSLTKKSDKSETISKALKTLSSGAPKNTFEVLQLMYIYFMISECVDHYQVRSLGHGIDATLYPYFKKDIDDGTYTKEEIARFIAYFFIQFHAMGSYWGQPMYLGGTNADGSTKVNEISYLILDIMDTLGIYNPKIQIKVSQSTPKDFLLRALEMIKGGSTGIVFCNEDIIVKSMMRSGAAYEEALDSVVKGCYEYALKAKSIGISFNIFNALKPILLVFNNGMDPAGKYMSGIKTGDVDTFKTFNEFYTAYLKQLEYIVKTSMIWICELEKYINDVNPTIFYSGTIPDCVNTLTDANDCGIKNVSDMLLNDFGSAIDSLMAVYELVYETKQTTMTELKSALDANWEGYEKLRLKALSCKHKYGIGDKIADYYANAVHNFFASLFHGFQNAHGGNFEYELHSARAFIELGERTEATPDGRRDGEETSKNASPTPGMDKNGVTALINSAATLDMSVSDSGACLDVMLHPSAVSGDNGLEILYGVLDTYMKKGGASIHFNIFNADTLRAVSPYQAASAFYIMNFVPNYLVRSKKKTYIQLLTPAASYQKRQLTRLCHTQIFFCMI